MQLPSPREGGGAADDGADGSAALGAVTATDHGEGEAGGNSGGSGGPRLERRPTTATVCKTCFIMDEPDGMRHEDVDGERETEGVLSRAQHVTQTRLVRPARSDYPVPPRPARRNRMRAHRERFSPPCAVH